MSPNILYYQLSNNIQNSHNIAYFTLILLIIDKRCSGEKLSMQVSVGYNTFTILWLHEAQIILIKTLFLTRRMINSTTHICKRWIDAILINQIYHSGFKFPSLEADHRCRIECKEHNGDHYENCSVCMSHSSVHAPKRNDDNHFASIYQD